MSDKQTSEFSSYSMFNVFEDYYQDECFESPFSFDEKDTPKVREDLKTFVKTVSKHFLVYNTLPWL